MAEKAAADVNAWLLLLSEYRFPANLAEVSVITNRSVY